MGTTKLVRQQFFRVEPLQNQQNKTIMSALQFGHLTPHGKYLFLYLKQNIYIYMLYESMYAYVFMCAYICIRFYLTFHNMISLAIIVNIQVPSGV